MSYDHTNGSFDLREINVTHMATTPNWRRFMLNTNPSRRSIALEPLIMHFKGDLYCLFSSSSLQWPCSAGWRKWEHLTPDLGSGLIWERRSRISWDLLALSLAVAGSVQVWQHLWHDDDYHKTKNEFCCKSLGYSEANFGGFQHKNVVLFIIKQHLHHSSVKECVSFEL